MRELENLLENLVITVPGDMIKRDYLPRKFQKSGETETPGEDDGVILPLKEYVERAESAAISRAIQKCGSVRKAAAALSVNPSTLVRKMQGQREK